MASLDYCEDGKRAKIINFGETRRAHTRIGANRLQKTTATVAAVAIASAVVAAA